RRISLVAAVAATVVTGCSSGDRTACEAYADTQAALGQIRELDLDEVSVGAVRGALSNLSGALVDLGEALDIEDEQIRDEVQAVVEAIQGGGDGESLLGPRRATVEAALAELIADVEAKLPAVAPADCPP